MIENLNYHATSRDKLANVFGKTPVVKAMTVITTNDCHALVLPKQYGDGAGLYIPNVTVTDHDKFESQVLTSDQILYPLQLGAAALQQTAEATYLGTCRKVPPRQRQAVITCAVELDLSTTAIPLISKASYEWQHFDDIEETIANSSADPHTHARMADSHYALQRYLDTMTYTE